MCFAQRKKPACVVGILSAVVLSAAIAMIALSVRFTGADLFKAFKEDDAEISKLKNISFYILISFSGIVFLLGIWGLLLLKCTNRCCSILFGVCIMPTWVIIFVFGCVMAWFSNSSPSTIQ